MIFSNVLSSVASDAHAPPSFLPAKTGTRRKPRNTNDDENSFGQLGYPSDGAGTPGRLSPRRVEDLRGSFVLSVAAGDRHTVALTDAGEVYCWGDNRSGQLGRYVAGGGGSSPSQVSFSRPWTDGLWGLSLLSSSTVFPHFETPPPRIFAPSFAAVRQQDLLPAAARRVPLVGTVPPPRHRRLGRGVLHPRPRPPPRPVRRACRRVVCLAGVPPGQRRLRLGTRGAHAD